MKTTQEADQILRRMKDGVIDGNVAVPVVALFEQLLEGQSAQYPYQALADFLVYFAATPKGSLDGCYGEWEELVYQNDWKTNIPSPATIMEHLAPFDQEPLPLNLTFNDLQMWHAVDGLLRLVFQCAQDLFDLKAGKFYVSFDISPMPFYGEIQEELIDGVWVTVEVASPSGQTATQQFKSEKGEKAKPVFSDTIWGHSYLVVCAHHWESKITFALAIRYVGDFNRDAVTLMDELVGVLEHYPRPDWIMADRGFCNGIVTAKLAKFCRNKPHPKAVDTHFLIPMKHERDRGDDDLTEPTTRRTPRQLVREMCDGSTKLKESPDTAYAKAPWTWTTDPDRIEHRLVFLYRRRGEFVAGSEIDIDGQDLDLDKDLVVTMFITNYVVTDDNIDFFNGLYGGRWAIEIVFKRHKRRAARSPSESEYLRFLSFGLSMLLYSCYGLWRWNRSVRTGLPFDHRQIRESRYLVAVRDAVLPRPRK